jgi:hypothetical protein
MINFRNRGRANRGTELLPANADVLTPQMSSLPPPIRPLFIVQCGFYEHDTFIGLTSVNCLLLYISFHRVDIFYHF